MNTIKLTKKAKNFSKSAYYINNNFLKNNFLTIIKNYVHLIILITLSFIPITLGIPVINIDNKEINTIKYSNYIKNSNLGNIFYSQNQPKNITENLSNLGLQYSLSSSFIKLGYKAKLELIPKTDYTILNSVYFQKEDKNLTYYKDYLITFNVDDSVVPYYNFHAEGVKNSSLIENSKEDFQYNSSINPMNNVSIIDPSKKFFDENDTSSLINKKHKYDISCEYTDNGLIYKTHVYNTQKKFTKIENILGLNFALTTDKKLVRLVLDPKDEELPNFSQKNITEEILMISNKTDTISISNFESINQKKFDDFYLVNQFYETGTFIFALGSDSSLILVYNITYWDFKGNYLVKLFTEFDLKEIFSMNDMVYIKPNSTNINIPNNNDNNNDNSSNSNNLLTITKYGTYKDTIIISTLEKGLVFINKNSQSGKWEPEFFDSVTFKNEKHKLKIRDMSINKNTIYIICEQYGMKIFDLKEKIFTQFEFNHPHLLKFDSNFRDNMPSPFYGLLIDNSNQEVNEFFIELKLKDYNEYAPQINRIFISGNKSAKSPYYMPQQNKNGLVSYTNQMNLGVIFDKLNQRILLIDRGVPSFAKSYTYKIDLQNINFFEDINQKEILDKYISNLNSIYNNSSFNDLINGNLNNLNPEIFVFSTKMDEFKPAILLNYSNNLTILFTEIKNSNVTFTCQFNDDGNFKMNFVYNSVCRKDYSWNSFDSYGFCPIFLTVPLQVQGGINLAMWIIIGVIGLALFMLVVFIICCFKGKKGQNYKFRGDREVKYSHADSQVNNNNDKKNNEVIEVQIIDNIK